MTRTQAATGQRSREQWQNILRSRGIRPTRSMGQNFLVEPEVVSRIADAAEIGPDSVVVEVGPGLGILTRELLLRGAWVVAIELDRELKAFLDQDLASFDKLTLIERDARHADLQPYVGTAPYQVVANLPYSTGTVILRRFIDLEHPPTSMTVMVQREVAERMIAAPPDMSLLAIAMQLQSVPQVEFLIPPDVFVPPPKVESAVVTLRMRAEPLATLAEQAVLFDIANMAFQRKRKTIGNGLSQGFDLPKPEVEARLRAAGIDPGLRPQAIALPDWIQLARTFHA